MRPAQHASIRRTSLSRSGVREVGTVEIEIGKGKSGRRAYGFDDIAIVPSRRTRDPEDVDISWEIDAFRFELPLMGAAMDGVVSPATAIQIGLLGGVGVLNLEGLWTRYDDPEPYFEEISQLAPDKATARMQQIYLEPIKPELITARIREIKDGGGRRPALRLPRSAPRSTPRRWWRPSSTCSWSRAPWCRPSMCPKRWSRST